MLILFCNSPLSPSEVDIDYQDEYTAATSCGLFEAALIDLDALVNENDAKKAVRKVPVVDSEKTAVYRGWMMTPDHYKELYDALKDRNITLINSPEQYVNAHHLPAWYNLVEKFTPKSLWISPEDFYLKFDAVMQQLKVFGNKPLIVKDYVKSRKHEWVDACFIPNASDSEQVKRVTNNFISRQGEDLIGGVVFREFIEFQSIGIHPKSSMPLTREYRAFFVNGKWMCSFLYWDEVSYTGPDPEGHYEFIKQFSNINSNFYTVDYACKNDGTWVIVEIGDGQVSGLPGCNDKQNFYAWLYHYTCEKSPNIDSFNELTSVRLKNGKVGMIVHVFPCSPPMYILDLADENKTLEIAHEQIERGEL